MNNMFSKAAIWVVIALVLFTVFKQFDERGIASGATPIAYSDFLDEVKAQRIREATIEDRTIIAVTNDGKKIKATTTNLDRGLIGDLVNNGVKFDVVPHAVADRCLDFLHAPDAGWWQGGCVLVR